MQTPRKTPKRSFIGRRHGCEEKHVFSGFLQSLANINVFINICMISYVAKPLIYKKDIRYIAAAL